MSSTASVELNENIWQKVGGKEGGTVSALASSPESTSTRTI
ncbi:MAG: hypothetical protein OXG11_00925 [Chloroflexi bacterium]|nr:hypothetical protein [Chloroflexota bacterium]